MFMTDGRRTGPDRAVEVLRSVRARPHMYFQPVDVPSAENFLNGFEVGCSVCGYEVPYEVRKLVTEERGWPWYAARPVAEMRAAGLDEAAVVDELLAIELAAWERWRDAPA
jgi:hypothetical protein